ncbi:hypothetical protein LOZ49_006589, partial [Ophidiomyces ophidiicola]
MTSSGKPVDEMFLASPPSAVSPLRIVKRESPSPSRAAQPPASASPLPYPDDRPQAKDQGPAATPRPPYPDSDPPPAASKQPARS